MNTKGLVSQWFDTWKTGDFTKLPITEDFKHTSPFGLIQGKEDYLNLVKNNKDKFLGYTFYIQDAIYTKDKACVRYTGKQGDSFSMEVSEWYYFQDNLIKEIVAYYHIGDIRKDRMLT